MIPNNKQKKDTQGDQESNGLDDIQLLLQGQETTKDIEGSQMNFATAERKAIKAEERETKVELETTNSPASDKQSESKD